MKVRFVLDNGGGPLAETVVDVVPSDPTHSVNAKFRQWLDEENIIVSEGDTITVREVE